MLPLIQLALQLTVYMLLNVILTIAFSTIHFLSFKWFLNALTLLLEGPCSHDLLNPEMERFVI